MTGELTWKGRAGRVAALFFVGSIFWIPIHSEIAEAGRNACYGKHLWEMVSKVRYPEMEIDIKSPSEQIQTTIWCLEAEGRGSATGYWSGMFWIMFIGYGAIRFMDMRD